MAEGWHTIRLQRHYRMNTRSSVSQGLKPGGLLRAGGFTVLEMICVVAIVALLVSVVMGSPGLVTSGRDTTAVQELAAVIDSARARSMRGVEKVWVAIGGADAPEPHAAYVICLDAADGSGNLVVADAWRKLPPGFVFTDTLPALASSGVNVLGLDRGDHIKTVESGNGRQLCAVIGFGPLGEVMIPKTDGRPLLVAFGPGQANGASSEAMGGGEIPPEKCSWVSVQPATGKVNIVP